MVMVDCEYYDNSFSRCLNIGRAHIHYDKIHLAKCIFIPIIKKNVVCCRCEYFENRMHD
jgi:hypothetical protein